MDYITSGGLDRNAARGLKPVGWVLVAPTVLECAHRQRHLDRQYVGAEAPTLPAFKSAPFSSASEFCPGRFAHARRKARLRLGLVLRATLGVPQVACKTSALCAVIIRRESQFTVRSRGLSAQNSPGLLE